MKKITKILCVVWCIFTLSAFIFVIGQQEYGLWQQITLTEWHRGLITSFGILLTGIIGVITITAYPKIIRR